MRGLGLAGVLVMLFCATAQAQVDAPRAVITSGPSGEVPETAASFEFEATGLAPFPSFACRVDAAPWVECAPPFAVKDLGGGRHVFEVRLMGRFSDPTPDRREWTVARRTEVLPPSASPLPDQPAVPVAPPPPRDDRRRDARGCAFAANEPGEVSGVRIRRAVRCLVNAERAARGLAPLRLHRRLETAATRHARDMVARAYFDHASPDGQRISERVRAAGYLRGAHSWTVGEVLAWLVRPRPTPVAVVEAWMKSRPHRAVLLRRSFREIGVAFRRGNPKVERGSGATFAAALGRRTF